MAAATYIFTKQKLAQVVNAGPKISFDNDTLVALWVVVGTAIPDYTKTGSAFISDVTASNAEVTGTGYARQTLTSVTVAYDGTGTTLVDFGFANLTWAQNASGFSNGRYLVFAKSTGTDSTSPVFAVFDPNQTVSVTGGDVIVSSPVGGMIQWQ